jgi:protein-S-isoprenylcysteine O-methyltransferase Ste14
MVVRKVRARGFGMLNNRGDRPHVIALPPFVLVATLASGFALDALWPLDLPAHVLARPLGAGLVAAGIAVAVLALRTMMGKGTSPDVRRPTAAIVTSGIFALTRNPVYLGMVLLALGMALIAGSLWLVVSTLVLAALLRYGVIAREEDYLERKFGADYLRYKAHVRRWI